jgi:two-component system phosphate regulon response regulator PhoB
MTLGRQAKVLVVDDEDDILRLLCYNLNREGYTISKASQGFEAITQFNLHLPDVVVLDWMLPDQSGLSLCKRFKQTGHPCRIIMLTARAAQQDRIEGLEAGADDYLTKPFSPRELVLRIKALLDRNTTVYAHQQRAIITLQQLVIDPNTPLVTVAGQPVDLSPLEMKLLYSLALHPNQVKSREQLLNDVWEQAAVEVLDRTVDAHIKRVRAKLGLARHQLETVRGMGYRLLSALPATP